MKKKVILFSSMLILGGGVHTLSVHAEDAVYPSQGSITFEEDTSQTKPVDPLNPDNPVTPTDPDGNEVDPDKGTPGPLSLDFASDFLFGTQKITTTNEEYYATLQSYKKQGATDLSTGPNYVQVTDKRGTQLGWSLSVKQEAQFKTAAAETLDGAAISFANATAVSAVDEQYKPTINAGATETVLVPGTETTIMTAAEKQGMGTWLYRLGDETTGDKSVKLSIPGKSIKLAKEYTTTLTWTLASKPVNE